MEDNAGCMLIVIALIVLAIIIVAYKEGGDMATEDGSIELVYPCKSIESGLYQIKNRSDEYPDVYIIKDRFYTTLAEATKACGI